MTKYLKVPANYLFCAQPRVGKTYNLQYILTKFCNSGMFSYGLVFTNTDDYDEMFPKTYIHKRLEESKPVIAKLKKLIQIQRTQKEINGVMPNCFVVFDDCLDFNFNSPFFKRFISECVGHYNISTFIAVQHLLAIRNPVVYRSMTFAFIFYQDDDRTLKTLYNEYGGSLWNNHIEMKKTVIEQCQDKHVLIINVNESDAKKKIIRYKAPKFKRLQFIF